jgi:hypothetical protein
MQDIHTANTTIFFVSRREHVFRPLLKEERAAILSYSGANTTRNAIDCEEMRFNVGNIAFNAVPVGITYC